MSRCKNRNNSKKASRFICLKCLNYDTTYICGIQRKNQREKAHIKDNICTKCGEVKTMEIRYCDYLPDVMRKAIKAHNEIYKDNIEYVDTEFYGKIYA